MARKAQEKRSDATSYKNWEEQVQAFLTQFGPITQRRYGDALKEFFAWYQKTYQEPPDIELLTAEELREYVSWLLKERKLQAASVNLRLTALKAMARFCGRELRFRGLRQVRPPVEALDAREIGRLFAALEGADWLSKRDTAIVALMARAGLRLGEVISLYPADLELRPRSGWITIRMGKGLKERRVPLSAEARRALQEYLAVRPEVEGPLFLSKRLKPLQPRNVNDIVKKAARKAGIKKRVTPHILRHTFATRFLQQGGDLATLREILGHVNIATTSRYLHTTKERMQELVEAL
jgi:integrase/recombinase XerC